MAFLRRWLASFALGLVAVAGWAAAPAGPDDQTAEYEVKAAFLYNFVKFVEWPADAFPDDRAPLAICVFGENPFGQSLEALVQGERVGERALVIQRPVALRELESCHVLFVSRSERHRLPEIFAAVDEAPVLTVGDTEGFLEAGGVINFVLEKAKVRFRINGEAAEHGRLRISSKLLRLGMASTP